MTADNKTIKKKIATDWQNRFPGLEIFSPNKLYKVMGPLVTGLELITIPRMNCYRPHVVIYRLWPGKSGSDVKACLEFPAVLMELRDKRNFSLDISYDKHDIVIDEAADCTRQMIPFTFENGVSLDELYALVDEHAKDVLIRSDDRKIARLEEFKMLTALYAGNDEYVKRIWDHIQQQAPRWDPERMAIGFGSTDEWIKRLQHILNNKQEFIQQIENNKADKKLAKLQQGQLSG